MERLRQFVAKLALVATTFSMALTGFVGTARAANLDMNAQGAVLSENEVSQTAVTGVISTKFVTSLTTGCYKIAFGGGTVSTGGSTTVVDWSNNGTANVTTGNGTQAAVAYPTTATVTIPFTGTVDNTRVVTATITGLTNSATAGDYDITVTTHAALDCSGASTDTSTVGVNPYRYTISSTNVLHTVNVAKTLQYLFTGQTAHVYKVNPANQVIDNNSNEISVQTNADSYDVYLHSLTNIAPARGGVVFPAQSWTGSHGTPATLNAGNSGFGYNIERTGVDSSEVADFATINHMAAFVTGATTNSVLKSTDPTGTNTDSARITYRAATNWGVKAGEYTFTTVFNVVPTYN